MSIDTLASISPDDRDSWPGELSEPARILLDYWVAKCRDGGFPLRSAIEPGEIVAILPYIFIVERQEGDYRFQLVGTRIVAVEGECTGAYLSDLFADRDRYADIWRHYDEACAGRIHVRRETLAWRDKDFISYEIILLPLCAPGGEVGHLIGTAHGSPLPRNTSFSRNARLIRPDSELPAVTRDADGIVTVDYLGGKIAVSPRTVRYSRMKVAELGNGEAVPVLVLAEATTGARGDLQAALAAPDHGGTVKAAAYVAATPSGRKLLEAFLASHRAPFPMRQFGSAEDARKWLRQFG